jgi:hypothetical protein
VSEEREALAAYAHEAWAAYMDYFLGKLTTQPDGGLLIPSKYVRALELLIVTPYANLPEEEPSKATLERLSQP